MLVEIAQLNWIFQRDVANIFDVEEPLHIELLHYTPED